HLQAVAYSAAPRGRVVRSVLPPRSREELATTEAPNRSEPPARADPEAPVTTSASPSTPFSARPVEFVFSVLGFAVGLLALPFALLFGGTVPGWFLGMVLFAAYWASGIALTRLALNLPPMHAVGVSGVAVLPQA